MNFKSFFSKPAAKDVFNSLGASAFIISASGEITDANCKALEMFKYAKSEIIGKYMSEYIEGGTMLVEKLVRDGKSAVVKARTSNTDEELFMVVSASQDNETQRTTIIMQDVTQLQLTANRLLFEYEETKKIVDGKNAFLAKLSNDILANMNSVTGFSKALLDGVCGQLNEKQEKYAKIINKNSADLLRSLDKVFELFRLESDLYEYDIKNFDIVNLVNGIIKEAEPVLEKKRLELKYDPSAVLKRNCFSSSSAITRIITMLIDNSLKSTNAGSVEITLSHPEIEFLKENDFEVLDENSGKFYFQFEIKDSGEGMTSEELINVFDPYVAIENQQKLDLSQKFTYVLSKHYLKRLKGKIWVKSVLERGTVVRFIIPIEKVVCTEEPATGVNVKSEENYDGEKSDTLLQDKNILGKENSEEQADG